MNTPRPPRIRLVNATGIGTHTKIIDADTGDDLTMALRISRIEIEADDVTTATLTSIMPLMDLAVNAIYTQTLEYDPTSPDSIEAAIAVLTDELTILRRV